MGVIIRNEQTRMNNALFCLRRLFRCSRVHCCNINIISVLAVLNLV